VTTAVLAKALHDRAFFRPVNTDRVYGCLSTLPVTTARVDGPWSQQCGQAAVNASREHERRVPTLNPIPR